MNSRLFGTKTKMFRWGCRDVGHKEVDPDMDLGAFPVGLGLPELEIASDAGLMREVFGKHLRPLNGKAYRIRDCVITRLRYRQAAGCILQYALRLLDPETGLERIHWVTGVMYREDRAERTWEKLRANGPLPVASDPSLSFEPNSFIPELKMLVQVFPYDRRLPSLLLLMSGLSPEVESLLLARFGTGRWRASACQIEPIRYRAWLTAVLRYSVSARDSATGRKEERRFYLKTYRDERGEQIYQLLRALWERDDTGEEGFTVGRPVAYLSDLHALIQEEAPGISFQQILLDGQDGEADTAARRVARAVAALHLDQIPAQKHRLLHDEVARLEDAGTLLQWACPHLSEEIEALVAAVAARLEGVPLRSAHLDLKTDHMLLDGERCALLDLDSFAAADPVLDPAHVLAQIIGLSLRFPMRRRRLRAAARAFAGEYFNCVPGDWRGRLPSHYAGAALHAAVGFFRRQEPQWPEKIAALVREAQDSLAGRVW